MLFELLSMILIVYGLIHFILNKDHIVQNQVIVNRIKKEHVILEQSIIYSKKNNLFKVKLQNYKISSCILAINSKISVSRLVTIDSISKIFSS